MLHGTIKFFGRDSSGFLFGYVYLDDGHSVAMDAFSVNGPAAKLIGHGKRITFDVCPVTRRARNAQLAR